MSKEEMDEFKKDYMKHGKFNLEVQVPHIEKLAEKYFERYKNSGDWTDALRAHSLYNSLRYREPTSTKWEQKSFEVQKSYWCGETTAEITDIRAMKRLLTEKLGEVRSQLRQELEPVESFLSQYDTPEKTGSDEFVTNFCGQLENISRFSTKLMVDVFEELIEQSMHSLKQRPPCAFVVVALGSMARGEATPYSDLEYIFIIERKDDQIEKYFEKLAMTSYFIIGNVGETKLNTMDIDELTGWFDDKQRNGLRIDGLSKQAGNIPTGNGQRKRNQFIVTPDELLSRYREVLANPVDQDARRGDLTALLQYTKSIFQYGPNADQLLQCFTSKKDQLAMNHCKIRMEANIAMFKDDAEKYNFRPETHVIENAYSINSKYELYRFPSILLFNLSILTGTCGSDSWQTLRCLLEKNEISVSLHKSLAFLLACSCYIRLSTYLHHDSQDDRLSVLPKSKTLKEKIASKAGRRWYLAKPLFLKMCEHLVPMKKHINKCANANVLDVVKEDIDSPTWFTRFQTLFCCHRWVDSWKEFEHRFSNQNLLRNIDDAMCALNSEVDGKINELWYNTYALGYVLFQQRKYTEGLRVYTNFLQLSKSIPVLDDSFKQIEAACLDQIALGHVYIDRHSCALKEYQSALDMRYECLQPNHELIAYSHCFIGRCLKHMKKHDEAEAHLVKALHIYNFHASREVVHDYYGKPVPHTKTYHSLEHITSPDTLLPFLNNSSIMLGTVLWQLGTIYFSHKWYQRASNYIKKTELMHEEMYGCESFHKDTSATYYYLSYCYTKLGDLLDAERYFRKSISTVTEHLYPQCFSSLIAAEEQSLLDSEGKTNYCNLVINMFSVLPGYKEPHAETAGLGLYAGIFLAHINQPAVAHRTLNLTIKMFEDVISNGCDSNLYSEDIAAAISTLGLNNWKSGDINSATEKFHKALAILNDIRRPSAQLEAAETLQNMGLMLAAQKHHRTAQNYLLQAQKLYINYCGDSSHPKIAEIESHIQQLPNPL